MCSSSYLLSAPVESVRGRKPRTKLQQQCLDLADTLPPLTPAQQEWARSKMAGLGYFVTRGRDGRNSVYWCQECGQADPADVTATVQYITMSKHRCSKCGRKLTIRPYYPKDSHGSLNHRKPMAEHNFQFGVPAISDGMQVLRVFVWNQYNVLGRDTVNSIDEVFQVWLEPTKCKEVIISKPYTRSQYHFTWMPGREWKVKSHNAHCSGYFIYDDVYSTENLCTYPLATLPVLRRNGWDRRMFSFQASPVDIWRRLPSDPQVETLAKTGQYRVLDYVLCESRINLAHWFPVLRICIRNHYVIQDVDMWFDYVELLEFFGKDLRNARYVCPSDLKGEHDRFVEKKRRFLERVEISRHRAEAARAEADYHRHRGRFFGLSFGNGRITVHVIRSVAEMLEEGTAMHHCVYTNGYYDHSRHPDSLILSARNADGKRLETIEVNLRTLNVVQCFGVCNSRTDHHEEIIEMVAAHKEVIRQRMHEKDTSFTPPRHVLP